MPHPTPLHGWQKPDEFQDPWYSTIDTLFDQIDAATVVSVMDFFSAAQRTDVLNGTHTLDVTSALQAAAQSLITKGGGVLSFPAAPAVCMINTSVFLGTKTRVEGHGCTLYANPGWVGVGDPNPAVTASAMLQNQGRGASGLSDSDIVIRDLSFDWSAVEPSFAIAIQMRNVDRLTISGCRSYRGFSLSSLAGCRDTLNFDCHATDWTGNASAAFAFHEAWVNGQVIACTGRTARSTYYGIEMSTAGGTSGQTAGNGLIMACQFYGCRYPGGGATAVFIGPYVAGTTLVNVRSIGNHYENSDTGLYFSVGAGSCSGIISESDLIVACGTRPVIISGPTPVRILNPMLVNCTTAAAGLLFDLNSTTCDILRIRVQGGTFGWIAGLSGSVTNSVVEIIAAPTGSSGRVSDSGTGNVKLDTYSVGVADSGGTGFRRVLVLN